MTCGQPGTSERHVQHRSVLSLLAALFPQKCNARAGVSACVCVCVCVCALCVFLSAMEEGKLCSRAWLSERLRSKWHPCPACNSSVFVALKKTGGIGLQSLSGSLGKCDFTTSLQACQLPVRPQKKKRFQPPWPRTTPCSGGEPALHLESVQARPCHPQH